MSSRIPLDPETVKELRTAAALIDGASAFQCWLDFLIRERSEPHVAELMTFANAHPELAKEIFVFGYCSAQVDHERTR